MFSSARMDQVIAPDRLSIRIRKQRERISRLLRKIARSLRRIDADRNWTNPLRVETFQTLFNTP